MASFKKTNAKYFSKPQQKLTADNEYWNKLGDPVVLKEFAGIDHVSFSKVDPYYFAITSSAKVQVYNPITKLVYKTLSKFREAAYGGTFRKDGKLLVAGGEDPEIKLFDVSSKNLLRVFKGHKGPIHRCFFTCDNTHISSFSDDKVVALWDIPSESRVASFSNHTDYVRAGAVSPVSSDIIISGSYDKTVTVYDTRSPDPVMNVNHGSPVESVLCLQSGGIFVSGGGPDVCVWDMLGGGKLLHRFSCHHKTVTSLCLASGGKRLISGSLDHHAKIYELVNFTPVHTLDYPSPVLSIDVSMNDEYVVAGMINGLVSIRKRDSESTSSETDVMSSVSNIGKVPVKLPDMQVFSHSASSRDTKEARRSVEQALREFKYVKALHISLDNCNKNQARLLATLGELIRRKGLHRAVVGLEEKCIRKLVAFITKHIDVPQYFDVLSQTTYVVIDVLEEMIASGLSPSSSLVSGLHTLGRRVKAEQDSLRELLELQGALQMVFSAPQESNPTPLSPSKTQYEPSVGAARELCVNVS
uniref:U3 small nucleolar RNA-associated protein 15 homolog n=1 Tax=Cacopsylla melanoneura TaxID=428564 RepID=A0A8D8MGH9_9HEMI